MLVASIVCTSCVHLTSLHFFLYLTSLHLSSYTCPACTSPYSCHTCTSSYSCLTCTPSYSCPTCTSSYTCPAYTCPSYTYPSYTCLCFTYPSYTCLHLPIRHSQDETTQTFAIIRLVFGQTILIMPVKTKELNEQRAARYKLVPKTPYPTQGSSCVCGWLFENDDRIIPSERLSVSLISPCYLFPP